MPGYDVPGWPLQLDKCPCDYDFLDWLRERKDNKSPVFHMGPGMHNIVGKQLINWGMDCFSVTISKEEIEANPSYVGSLFRGSYTVLLCDIASMYNWVTWPKFKVMTLFHLGEYYDEYVDVTVEVLDKILRSVELGGLVFFYTGSSAWDRMSLVVKESNNLKLSGGHKSILYYKKVA